MICWTLGWQRKSGSWEPVVYGALPGLLTGEPCIPTLVSTEKMNVTCSRCRKAFEVRGQKAIEKYLESKGL